MVVDIYLGEGEGDSPWWLVSMSHKGDVNQCEWPFKRGKCGARDGFNAQHAARESNAADGQYIMTDTMRLMTASDASRRL